MNIVKSAILVGCALACSPVAKQNEIVIKTGETKQSICEVAYHEYQACSLENNITISWNFVDEQSKHFSIERYIDGDINDAFIISKNLHVVENPYHTYSWHTLDVEGWINTDEHFFNMTFG